MIRIKSAPLEYIHAFDLCGSYIYFRQGSALILAGNEFYLSEMLERIYNKVHVIALKKTEEIKRLIYENSDFGKKVILEENIATVKDRNKFDYIVWLKCGGDEEILHELDSVLDKNGQILIMTSNLLQLLKIKKMLKYNDYSIQEIYGFHTFKNLTLSLFGRICKMFGRYDLWDKFHFKFRKDFVSTSWLKYTGAVLVLITSKGV